MEFISTSIASIITAFAFASKKAKVTMAN